MTNGELIKQKILITLYEKNGSMSIATDMHDGEIGHYFIRSIGCLKDDRFTQIIDANKQYHLIINNENFTKNDYTKLKLIHDNGWL